MSLKDRVSYFDYLFELLQDTSSRNEKQELIDTIPDEYKDDFNYIIYCLSNNVKFGYRYDILYVNDGSRFTDNMTIRDCLNCLREPYEQKDLTWHNIAAHICKSYDYEYFFEPIVNKTLRLGIGNSLIEKDTFAPMLAKKYEGKVYGGSTYYITEKLDGNRCIAHYDFDKKKWLFTSRNGKEMHVDFDMSGLSQYDVYDGEVLSPQQVKMSNEIYNFVNKGICNNIEFEDAFNSTSGLINTHSSNKDLVYNIFDIQSDVKYEERREYLNQLKPESNNVRILPLLKKYDNILEMESEVFNLLDKVTGLGGEGLMINLGNRTYENKRTDSLMKLKKAQTIDMRVTGTYDGTGKYEGMVGALHCVCKTDDGKLIECKVGSGLSDAQRLEWASRPENILRHIVEVTYFSLSQEAAYKGTNIYSLRFPRLKKVRDDKTRPSQY